jgi:prephenate dehydratase
MKIALSGMPGSFSEEAALIYRNRTNEDLELVYAVDMMGVLRAVNENAVDIGIFPVVNSRGGLVKPAFAAMGAYNFEMIDEVWLEVQQCLMKLQDVDISEIENITSHSQALAQCARYLDQNYPELKRMEWIDTALAAKNLAEGEIGRLTMVIAPARAAALYGLELVESGIQDMRPNLTTFIVVKKKCE